eukprot:340956-Prymnesium_polylepis.2
MAKQPPVPMASERERKVSDTRKLNIQLQKTHLRRGEEEDRRGAGEGRGVGRLLEDNGGEPASITARAPRVERSGCGAQG